MLSNHLAGRFLCAALLLLVAGCGGKTDVPTRIFVVTFDTTRADRLGCYGYEEDEITPNLDRFAAESVLFENAVSQVPTTLPSHSTMFTGRYPQDHGVRYNIMYRLGADATTLAESLREAGYATAAFPAAFVLGRKFGMDQGFDAWFEPPGKGDLDVDHMESIIRPANEIVDLALGWLSTEESPKVFAWLHFYDPHHPYNVPFPFSSRFRDRPYEGEIAFADQQFGRFMEQLRQHPDWERTLVVVAGDHGEGLFEHAERFHSLLVYDTTQHVPFIVRAPGARARRESEPVALADLMPTVVDLAGLPVPEGLRGISLVPALEGGRPPERDIYFETLAGSLNYGWQELRGLRSGRWKLIDSEQPELFDVDKDPAELMNLAPLEPEMLQELRDALATLKEPLAGEGAQEPATENPVLDAETEALLASLGYVGGGTSGSAEGAPNPRDLVSLQGEMISAQRAIFQRNWDFAADFSRGLLEMDSSNKWALNTLAGALLNLNEPREAQDVAAELLRYYPDQEVSYSTMARAYQAQGLAADAYRVLAQGLSVLPESESLLYLSIVAAFEAEHDGLCSTEVPEAIQAFPRSPRMLILRARCEASAGRDEDALASIGAAVDLGFRRIEPLGAAAPFASLAQSQGFKELLARVQSESDTGESSADSSDD